MIKDINLKTLANEARKYLLQNVHAKKQYVLSTAGQFLLTLLYSGAAIVAILDVDAIVHHAIIMAVPMAAFLLTGAIIDIYKNLQNLQIRNNIMCASILFLYYFLPEYQEYIGLIYMFFVGINIVVTLYIFSSQTNALNRGRLSMFYFFGVMPVFGLLLFFLYLLDFNPMYFGVFCLAISVGLWFWEHRHPFTEETFFNYGTKVNSIYHLGVEKSDIPEDMDLKEIVETSPDLVQKVVKTWFQSFVESGFIFILLIATILSGVVGFNISVFSFLYQTPEGWALYVFLVMAAVFVSALILDYIGRKPVALICAGLMGVYVLFFDIFSQSWYFTLWFLLFPITVSLALMFLASITGDFSETFQRGSVLALVLTCLIIGSMVGLKIRTWVALDPYDLTDNETILISDINSLMVVVVLFMLNFTPEPFEREAIKWKKYLDRLLVVTHTGTNLYFYDFNKMEGQSGDLLSGGITGIQMLLKEISGSHERLQVLDHSDRKFLFAHGEYCTSILISKKNLTFLRTKVNKFQKEFEEINEEILKNFTGLVTNLDGTKKLMKEVFHEDI